MIWWHGKSSDDVGVIVEHSPEITIPTRKRDKISIQGRSGDLLMEQDAYENYTQTYEIYISAERPRLTTISHTIAEWLMVKGYQRLEDSYWLDTFRLATYIGGTNIENVLNRFGRASIEFDCKPQRYYKSGEIAISVENGQSLYNLSPFTAKPLITVNGSGNGAISDGVHTLTLTDCNGITIDCDILQLFKGTENKNSVGSGSFLELGAGETEISWSGGITGVTIIPRWWTL